MRITIVGVPFRQQWGQRNNGVKKYYSFKAAHGKGEGAGSGGIPRADPPVRHPPVPNPSSQVRLLRFFRLPVPMVSLDPAGDGTLMQLMGDRGDDFLRR